MTVERILGLLKSGDFAGAAQLADQAIAAGDAHPLFFAARGTALEQRGQIAEALADYERGLVLDASNPGLHDSAARCLIMLDRWADAIVACDRAIALAPRFAPAWYDKGCAAEMTGDIALAARCYRQAATLDPAMADATARLAALATRRGDWTEAEMLAGHALAQAPGNTIATLASVTAMLGRGEAVGQAARLEVLLATSGLPPQIRAQALSLIGDARDREDRTAEAFAAYDAANRELLKAYAPRFPDPGADRIARLMRDFTAIDLRRWGAPVPASATSHIFVLGFYRAGTTLLGQVLASHPAVATLEEKPLLIDAASEFLEHPGGLARLAALGETEAARFRDLYWQRVRALEPARKIIVDKLPLNTIALPVIARLFPEAPILFCVRDPRDVVFSCFRRLLNVNRDTYEMLDLERGARFYAAIMDLAATYRAALPLNLLEVRNEGLAADFEGVARAMCDFLGLGWSDKMASFAEQSKRRAIATPSAAQVARGINSDGVGQWRRYRRELAPALPILQPWVERFGYPPD